MGGPGLQSLITSPAMRFFHENGIWQSFYSTFPAPRKFLRSAADSAKAGVIRPETPTMATMIRTPTRFPDETTLMGEEAAQLGLMVWSSPTARTSNKSMPDSFWLEALSGSDATPSFRLAWSRQGAVLGDVRWFLSLTGPGSERLKEVALTGPAFQVDGMLSSLREEERCDRVVRAWGFAQSITDDIHVDCVLAIDALSLKEVQRFSGAEGSCLSQALEICHWQSRILGPEDRSLSDHRRIAQAASAAQAAKDAAAADLAVQGGWARRLFAGLRSA